MIMKKMLSYILSSVFLLAILSACESSDDTADTGPIVTLADLAGTFTGDSKLDLNFLLTTPVAVRSDKATDGASVKYKETETDNLEITLTDAQLSTASGTAVSVGLVFTFTIDGLLRKNDEEEGEIVYNIGDDGGTVEITAGSVSTTVDLTDVVTSIEEQSGVSLTAKASLTQADATSLIAAFDPSATAPTAAVVVEITLAVTRITDRDPAPAPTGPTLADLAGDYTGDSDLDFNFPITPAVAVTSDLATDGAVR